MPSHGSVSSGTKIHASPSLLGSSAISEDFDEDEPVKNARHSRLNATTYNSPPSAARTRVMCSQSMHAPAKPLVYTPSLSPSSRRNRSSTLYDDQNQNHNQQSYHHKHHSQQQEQQQQQPRLRSALSPLAGKAVLASPTTTTIYNVRSSPKQRSSVWDELENVKERLNRLKVSSPTSGRRSSLDNTSSVHMDMHYPASENTRLHKSNSISGPGFSHSSLGHHPVHSHTMDPPQSASNLLSVTRAPPPASPTQAARHLRDVLARIQSCQDVNILLLERTARDILALYDDPSGPDPRGIDQACLSLGSYIMQTLDTAVVGAAAESSENAPGFASAPPPATPTTAAAQSPLVSANPVQMRDIDSPRRAGFSVRRYGATGPTSNKRHSLTFM